MYLKPHASRRRKKEAQNARNNRAEIVKALSQGQVSRRELFKWGIFTGLGTLANVNGLSPFATSAYAAVPTGVPRSPTFGALPFTQPMPRLRLEEPHDLVPRANGGETELAFPSYLEEPAARRLSYHTDFDASGRREYRNPKFSGGPMEGRPPGEYFAHQRWLEYLPKKGFIMTLGRLDDGFSFHPNFPDQDRDSVWTFNSGRNEDAVLPPPLMKMRYGEPVIFRHYNQVPDDPKKNNGFGSISQATHNHNAHNASASDGASNAHFFPGQFYDYHWSTTLARADMINTNATDRRASGPDGDGGLNLVKGDFRELQSSLWFHDHRFFFTAENVYKGHLGALNYYSGPDRGNERVNDGVNLRLPSGTELDWGNIDFDVNLIISDAALDEEGQYFFDIFETNGFLGDLMLVNFAYKPYFEVLPRKYRFRLLNACMARFIRPGLINQRNRWVPMTVIATDGNLMVNPVKVNQLDPMGPAERFDVVVDFSQFPIGSKIRMLNVAEHESGERPKEYLSRKDAIDQDTDDPAVGTFLEFRVVDRVKSVDNPGKTHYANAPDYSRVPSQLTEQIPIIDPVRVRHIEWKGTDEPGELLRDECFPDCDERNIREGFGWTVRINGESNHFLNANRVSMLVPRPGETEHWILSNGSGGWDHPIHLHFEEGITIDRGGRKLSALERNVRKDVWRTGRGGQVKIQVTFGEYGGAYVTHCHNTVHEDWAMLARYDVLTDPTDPKQSKYHVSVVPTPNPTKYGVTFVDPEILPEGNPFDRDFEGGVGKDDDDEKMAASINRVAASEPSTTRKTRKSRKKSKRARRKARRRK
ncbi:MAG: multicopper oxidase family protein [Limimaricola soesokkakensis]|uniref:multicopper oxidase family protein n=1 Tax=Limimaricola soesokkakensis TaxID=1343159 RepID=UPI00405A3F93